MDAPLDPAIFRANISALRHADLRLAVRIDGRRLSGDWRSVKGLDGSTTFRRCQDDRLVWLDATAAPRIRAEGLLREFRAGDRAVALASVGTGEEICRIVEQMTDSLALFVFEPDLEAIRAVLQRCDLAAAIERGTLRFLTESAPESALRAYLAAFPGLRAPQVLLSVPTVPPDRIEATRSAIETVGRECDSVRTARIAEIAASLQAPRDGRVASGRVAFLSLAPLADVHSACRKLAGVGTDDGRFEGVSAFIVDHPEKGHPVAAAEFLGESRPSVVVWTGAAPPPACPPDAVRACWHTTATRLPDSLPKDHLHLAASPTLLDELKEIDSSARILPFYWPAPRIEITAQESAPDIVLVADLPDDSADACGIKQATHRTLWDQMRSIANARWFDPAMQHPGNLLTAAEKAAGLRIGESTIRRQMLRIVRHVLIPACGLRRIRESVERNRTRLKLVGRGWRHQGADASTIASDDLSSLGTMALNIRPLAAVFSLAGDPFSPALLTALSAGWPVILHAPLGVRGLAGIGAEHVLSFGDEAGLRRCIQSAENVGESRRRAEMAREFVHTTHSAVRRLNDLRKRLSG